MIRARCSQMTFGIRAYGPYEEGAPDRVGMNYMNEP